MFHSRLKVISRDLQKKNLGHFWSFPSHLTLVLATWSVVHRPVAPVPHRGLLEMQGLGPTSDLWILNGHFKMSQWSCALESPTSTALEDFQFQHLHPARAEFFKPQDPVTFGGWKSGLFNKNFGTQRANICDPLTQSWVGSRQFEIELVFLLQVMVGIPQQAPKLFSGDSPHITRLPGIVV